MARGVKQQKSKINTDFSITDAVKRAKRRREQINAAADNPSNKIDDLNDELNMEGMSEMEKDIFEN